MKALVCAWRGDGGLGLVEIGSGGSVAVPVIVEEEVGTLFRRLVAYDDSGPAVVRINLKR